MSWNKTLCYWKIIIQNLQQYHHLKFQIFSYCDMWKNTLKDYLKNSLEVILVPINYMMLLALSYFRATLI